MQYIKKTSSIIPLFLTIISSVNAEMLNNRDTNTRFLQPEKKALPVSDNKSRLSAAQLIQPKPVLQQTKPIFQQSQPVVNTIKANNAIPTHTPTEKTWEIIRGKDLRAQLDGWSTTAGWSLVWDSEYSYSIQANASFKGDYISAVKKLFSALGEDVNPKLYPELYQGNRVLKVTNQAR